MMVRNRDERGQGVDKRDSHESYDPDALVIRREQWVVHSFRGPERALSPHTIIMGVPGLWKVSNIPLLLSTRSLKVLITSRSSKVRPRAAHSPNSPSTASSTIASTKATESASTLPSGSSTPRAAKREKTRTCAPCFSAAAHSCTRRSSLCLCSMDRTGHS